MKRHPFKYFIYFTLGLLSILSCNNQNNKENKVNATEIEIKIERFDQKFDSISNSNIFELKNKYPFLFPKKYSDSFWIDKSNDTIYKILRTAVNKKFSIINNLEKEISHFYKHIKHEFPKTKIPRIVSVINNVDYNNKLILADSLLIISIDSYLGFDHDLYSGIPLFIKKKLDLEYLISQIADIYADKLVSPPLERNFLSKIIFHGKKLYFKDIIIPHKNDAVKIEYNENENSWAKENELFIWQYIVEKKILYDNDNSLEARFLLPAPFSKFYLEIDNDSPGRIGQWIGWQIVRSYANRYPEIGIEKIINLSAHEIFINSKYKPKKKWH